MLADPALQADLQHALEAMARQPLLVLLESQGVLHTLVQQRLLEQLRRAVAADPAEASSLVRQICAAMELAIPSSLEECWLEAVPQPLRSRAEELWQQSLLRRALELRYGDRVEAHFLRRRAALDQVVFRMMRLERLGLAEELYLRLVDDHASFGELADQHALGEERHTRGLVGPMAVGQPHPRIAQALARLVPGELHPPFSIDNAVVLVRLEKRLPAQLNDPLRRQLLRELLEAELQDTTAAVIQGLLQKPLVALESSVAPVAP